MLKIVKHGDVTMLMVSRSIWDNEYDGQSHLTEQYTQEVIDFLMDYLPYSVVRRAVQRLSHDPSLSYENDDKPSYDGLMETVQEIAGTDISDLHQWDVRKAKATLRVLVHNARWILGRHEEAREALEGGGSA